MILSPVLTLIAQVCKPVDADPELSLLASNTNFVAPLGVVFSGADTKHPSTTNPFRDLLYFFDFGDTSAGVYTNGELAGQTTNRHVGGPVCAHTYEVPGTYTARMWAYDGTKVWGPVTQTIVVQDPDVVYAGTLTVCVSDTGDFTGAPSGAVQVTTTDYRSVVTTYAGTGNRRFLLRAGGSFTQGTAWTPGGGFKRFALSTFGGTARATITATAAFSSFFSPQANGNNAANNFDYVALSNIKFDGGGFAVGGIGSYTLVQTSGTRSYTTGHQTVHNCEFTRTFGVSCMGYSYVFSKNNINAPYGLGGSIGIYAGGAICVGIVDNVVDNVFTGEHCIRLHADITATISNYIARPAITKHYYTLRGWVTSLASEAGKDGYYHVCASNTFDVSTTTDSAQDNIWVIQVAPTNAGVNEPIRDVIIEGNRVYGIWGSQNIVTLTARRVTVRNNLFMHRASAGSLTNVSCNIVSISGMNNTMTQVSEELHVVGNSAFGGFVTSVYSFFRPIASSLQATISGVVLRGNIAYAPNAGATSAFIYPNTSSVLSSPTIEQNSTDAQIRATNPLWVDSSLTSWAAFKLQSASPYKSAVITAGGRYIEGRGNLLGSLPHDAGATLDVDQAEVSAWSLVP